MLKGAGQVTTDNPPKKQKLRKRGDRSKRKRKRINTSYRLAVRRQVVSREAGEKGTPLRHG